MYLISAFKCFSYVNNSNFAHNIGITLVIIVFNEKPAFGGIEHLVSANEPSEKAHTVLPHTQRY